jgi:hypothetical protein
MAKPLRKITYGRISRALSILHNTSPPVLRIRDILVRIRIWISGSVPLTIGSGSSSRSCYYSYFRQWPSRHKQKTIFFVYYFLKVHLHVIKQ